MGQSKSAPAPASSNGAMGALTRLDTLHYSSAHGLRRGPDGQWIGKATRGGIEKSVTVTPQGAVVAR